MRLLLMMILLCGFVLSGCQSSEQPEVDTTIQDPEVRDENFAEEAEIGLSLSELKEMYGTPKDDSYYEGGRYVTFDKGSYFIDDNETVFGRLLGPNDSLSVYGATVGMSFTEIKESVGLSADTEVTQSDLDGEYHLYFNKDNFEVDFSAPSADEPTNFAIVTTNPTAPPVTTEPAPITDVQVGMTIDQALTVPGWDNPIDRVSEIAGGKVNVSLMYSDNRMLIFTDDSLVGIYDDCREGLDFCMPRK